jgi:FAD/FMN-containing dehydrogenase
VPVADLVAALRAAGVPATGDPARRRAASRDHSWLSPVLARRLPAEPAAAVAAPRSVDELAVAVGTAHRLGVPVTTRGRGTGNYGQAVPLAGGLVVDVTGVDRILHVEDGWAVAETGVSFTALERAARAAGQELALFPSTVASTVGGFLAGGAGGSGSIEHGFVWDGFVGAVDVLDCTDRPVAHAVTGTGCVPHLHAYGTTGVITTARIRLDEARSWTGAAASFTAFDQAAAAARDLLDRGVALRLLSVDDPAVVADLAPRALLREGRASLRAVVTEDRLDEVAGAVARRRGVLEAAGPGWVPAITALSFNHVTLRARQRDDTVCHVQVGGAPLTERTAAVLACLPAARLHLDALRSLGGVGFGGLLLSRYEGEARLRDGMATLEGLGVHVVDAHRWSVDDPTGARAEVAARLDPQGLLNPGKLARPHWSAPPPSPRPGGG